MKNLIEVLGLYLFIPPSSKIANFWSIYPPLIFKRFIVYLQFLVSLNGEGVWGFEICVVDFITNISKNQAKKKRLKTVTLKMVLGNWLYSLIVINRKFQRSSLFIGWKFASTFRSRFFNNAFSYGTAYLPCQPGYEEVIIQTWRPSDKSVKGWPL